MGNKKITELSKNLWWFELQDLIRKETDDLKAQILYDIDWSSNEVRYTYLDIQRVKLQMLEWFIQMPENILKDLENGYSFDKYINTLDQASH